MRRFGWLSQFATCGGRQAEGKWTLRLWPADVVTGFRHRWKANGIRRWIAGPEFCCLGLLCGGADGSGLCNFGSPESGGGDTQERQRC